MAFGLILPYPLFCWSIFFTYIHIEELMDEIDGGSPQPLNHSTFGKGKEVVFKELLHMCAALHQSLTSMVPFKSYENFVKWLLYTPY